MEHQKEQKMKLGRKRASLAGYFFFCLACQALSISASRSAEIPARRWVCLSAGCSLNHSSVACAVSPTDRKVSPSLTALLLLSWVNPISGPRGADHTGMSYHG